MLCLAAAAAEVAQAAGRPWPSLLQRLLPQLPLLRWLLLPPLTLGPPQVEWVLGAAPWASAPAPEGRSAEVRALLLGVVEEVVAAAAQGLLLGLGWHTL